MWKGNKTMELLDYLQWRNDVPLSVFPFNEVDNVIFSYLSYIDFRDLNEDGINELLLARKGKSDDSQYYMHAVYYLEDGTTPKLAVQGFVGSGGARQGFNVYPEGKLSEVGFSSGTGNGSIFVYQLTKDSKRELIAKKEFERLEFELEDVGLNQNDIIDYQDFNWQPLFN